MQMWLEVTLAMNLSNDFICLQYITYYWVWDRRSVYRHGAGERGCNQMAIPPRVWSRFGMRWFTPFLDDHIMYSLSLGAYSHLFGFLGYYFWCEQNGSISVWFQHVELKQRGWLSLCQIHLTVLRNVLFLLGWGHHTIKLLLTKQHISDVLKEF